MIYQIELVHAANVHLVTATGSYPKAVQLAEEFLSQDRITAMPCLLFIRCAYTYEFLRVYRVEKSEVKTKWEKIWETADPPA